MASINSTSNLPTQQQPTEFELRRADLVGQIGESLEQVLTQINALNRQLESIIEIGNEFASVEALWSQFESVMESQKVSPDVESPGEARDEVVDRQQRPHQH